MIYDFSLTNSNLLQKFFFLHHESLLAGPTNDAKNGYELMNGANCMAANRLSYFYDFKGPSMVIDTACSASTTALTRAVQDIEAGIIDKALVCGATLSLDPHKSATYNGLKMLSPTGHCYSFDSRADGYCRSDGIVCVVIERGTHGYAQIGGIGANCDGFTQQGK